MARSLSSDIMVNDDNTSKKQKTEDSIQQDDDMDMGSKPSYAHITVEGEEEDVNDQ